MTTCLELKGVAMTYPGLPVLEKMDLDIPTGRITALVGPSGCGKSTLLRIAGGLLKPTVGQVFHSGRPMEPDRHRDHFGLMNQKDLLLPWFPLWKNVALPLRIRGETWKQAEPRVQALLEEFGLGKFREYFPHQLSGGMRQRGAFLRAYLANPAVLLLDEPFASLDALTRKDLQIWLHDAWQTHRSTILLVTHSLEEALLLAHRVVVLTGIPGSVQAIHDLPFGEEELRSKSLHPAYLEELRSLENSLLEASGRRES